MSDVRVNDWMKLNCGDHVVEWDGQTEGRHVGRVEAIHHGAFVIVKWLDTGWISQLPLGSVRKVKKEEDDVGKQA